jgi:hypothetical protein
MDSDQKYEQPGPPFLVTLTASSKCGVLFCVGALVALRDLGILQQSRLIQGVGMGNVVLAQFFSALHTLEKEGLRRDVVKRSAKHVTHTELMEHQGRAVADAWTQMCTGAHRGDARDALIERVFRPLVHRFGVLNHERLLLLVAISELWNCRWTAWEGTYSKLFHSPAVPWNLQLEPDEDEAEEATLRRFAMPTGAGAHLKSSIPICVFSACCAKTQKLTCFTNDTTATVAEIPHLELRRPETGLTLGRILAFCVLQEAWAPGSSALEYHDAVTVDPTGFTAANHYFLRFRPPASRGTTEDDEDELDRCLVVVDGTCTPGNSMTQRWMLSPSDRLHQTPRLYKDQCVNAAELPVLQGTPEEQRGVAILLQQMKACSGWVAEDATLLLHCANLGHALTHFRFGSKETRRSFTKLLIENIGDPYDILPNLFGTGTHRVYTESETEMTPLL